MAHIIDTSVLLCMSLTGNIRIAALPNPGSELGRPSESHSWHSAQPSYPLLPNPNSNPDRFVPVQFTTGCGLRPTLGTAILILL